MNKINSLVIYDGIKTEVLNISDDETIKFQAIGSGTYSIKGKIANDCAWDDICAIKASDFETSLNINDNAVWIADVTGYSQITVEASGFDKIYCVTVG